MGTRERSAGRLLIMVVAALAAIVATLVGVGVQPAAALTGTPFGFLDVVATGPSGVAVTGWTIDPDTSAPVDVRVHRDGTYLGVWKADAARPDVAAVYPGWGVAHGFALLLPTDEGPHTFCVDAVNVGPGDPSFPLGCRDVVVTHDPFGSLDAVQRVPGTGDVTASGWALDVDTTNPVSIHLYVDDVFVGQQQAGGYRSDIATQYPWSGGRAAFAFRFPGTEGTHRACAYALGTGPGAGWVTVSCTWFTFAGATVGLFEAARFVDGALRVSGWAYDPDSTAQVQILYYTDGAYSAASYADIWRGDVEAAIPAYGGNHGFSADLPMSPGAAEVCAYAVNVGAGPDYVLLGCRRIGPLPPPDSGSGRRIVYANLSQRLWLIGDDGFVDRTYLVSGRYLDPPPGIYWVYDFVRYASAGHDGITMEYFVAFHPEGLGYGFHTIPVYADGTPLQSEDELGSFRSAGCVRQALADAVYMWNWARYGDPVVVLAR